MSNNNIYVINNKKIDIPGISIPIDTLGTISNISIFIKSGTYNPIKQELYITDGELSYTGGSISGPATTNDFRIQDTDKGLLINGTACVNVFIFGKQCRNIDTTINYSTKISKSNFESLIATIIDSNLRVGYFRKHIDHIRYRTLDLYPFEY